MFQEISLIKKEFHSFTSKLNKMYRLWKWKHYKFCLLTININDFVMFLSNQEKLLGTSIVMWYFLPSHEW